MNIEIKMCVGNLLVYVKGLNETLEHYPADTETANDYGRKINDNLNTLAELLNVRLVEGE